MLASQRPRRFPGNVVHPFETGPLPPVQPPNWTPHVPDVPSIVQLLPSKNSYPERFKEDAPRATTENAKATDTVANVAIIHRFKGFMTCSSFAFKIRANTVTALQWSDPILAFCWRREF